VAVGSEFFTWIDEKALGNGQIRAGGKLGKIASKTATHEEDSAA